MDKSNSLRQEPAEAAIRVMIADDHPIVRRGIANELSRHHDVELVSEANNGDDVVRRVCSLALDVLVLDINMPGASTIDILSQIKRLPSAPAVLILTAHSDAEYIMGMLKAGAKGYMLKDESPETIATAVRKVARGETWLSSSVMNCVVSYSVQRSEETPEAPLSVRELDVLGLLVQGLDNQEIGDELCISERTVRFHLHNIYDKLAIRGRSEAIVWGMRHGIGPQLAKPAPLLALAVGAAR